MSGGTVTANAGTSGSGGGAGIGSGTSSSSVGNILIYGENTRVTAKRSGTIANTQDIGHGGNASAIANVFVALPQGNLLGTGDLEIGNPVLFTATPTSADVVTVTLPSPFNAAPFTVGGEYELLTGLDQVGKTLSVITTFGATDNIAFALNGYNANPDPATGSHLMTSGAQVNFTVPAATVTGIAVLSQPTTLSYTEGHILNLAGLVVKLTYSDGSSATVPFADFVAEGITTHPTHGTTLTLAHNATQVIVTHTASGETAVTNALIVYAATLDSIAVTTMPTKTTYTVGENLDLAGLVITATYSNSSTSVVT
ncbi:MAG: bacterial Ig-like domain-containing protein, partial [Proteobacteria bacterium]|nr:bacterial Ig-like domain-containing protein [Pseudomonadota bacterium]